MRMHYFNPRSPCGERRVDLKQEYGIIIISIHAPRAGSDAEVRTAHAQFVISIHAPRAGSDPIPILGSQYKQNFNPRSPCGERHDTDRIEIGRIVFQSTLPVRGATISGSSIRLSIRGFQSTLPVRGATAMQNTAALTFAISIHAPRAGSDMELIEQEIKAEISIHAPRAGSDGGACLITNSARIISIHAPRAGSDEWAAQKKIVTEDISIHAPRAGSDQRPA